MLPQALIQLYGVMSLGFLLAKVNILDEQMNRKLSSMVVIAIYPMMLLYSMTGQSGDRSEALVLLGIGFILYAALVFFAKGVVWLLRVPQGKSREFECLIVFGNTGFIGAPLAQALYGSASFFQMALLHFAYYFFYNTYAVKALSPQYSEKQGFAWKNLFSPGFVMTLLAVVMYLVEFNIPPLISDMLYMVGNMTTPLSMLILGSSIAIYPFRQFITDPWSYVYGAIKLLALPILSFFICRLTYAGSNLGNLIVLSNAMPAGSMVLMLALQLNRDSGFISRSIFVSTLLFAITLPTIMVFLL